MSVANYRVFYLYLNNYLMIPCQVQSAAIYSVIYISYRRFISSATLACIFYSKLLPNWEELCQLGSSFTMHLHRYVQFFGGVIFSRLTYYV